MPNSRDIWQSGSFRRWKFSFTSAHPLEKHSSFPSFNSPPSWICCQLGAREHYAVPRSLKRLGVPVQMITDIWCRHRNLPQATAFASLQARFHPELSAGEVNDFTLRTITRRIGGRLLRRSWYREQETVNKAFQRDCLATLKNIPEDSTPRLLFAYSYAAKEILAYGRERGWTTVLGQIDPGPGETRIVIDEYLRLELEPGRFYTPPPGYWNDWHAETELADLIVVNSGWSAQCLRDEGIPGEKIRIIPCAYSPDPAALNFHRRYPASFSRERPMNVLFLGQPVIRKGIHLMIEAAGALLGQPVQFTIVGGETDLPATTLPANVNWVGRVPRHAACAYYRDADVFLLPTLSDGFALTQLEAAGWKLPMVVSRRCGEVIEHGKNGLVLEELNATAIERALSGLLSSPGLLQQMSDAANDLGEFGLEAVGEKLAAVTQSTPGSSIA